MSDLKIPEFDPTKPLYVHMHNLQQYYIKIKEPKYKLILEFVNKFYDSNFTSLKEFQSIDIDKIDRQKFKDLLEVEDYKDKLEGELQIDIDEIKLDIVNILAKCVESIDYSLYRKKVEFEKKNKKTGDITITKKTFISILTKPKRT